MYVDDGHSFNYKTKGEYIRRRFTYANNVLKCEGEQQQQAPSTTKSTYTIPNTVEKIILLGVYKEPQKVTLKNNNKGGSSEEEVKLEYEYTKGELVVRKPNSRIADDWEIQFEFGWF